MGSEFLSEPVVDVSQVQYLNPEADIEIVLNGRKAWVSKLVRVWMIVGAFMVLSLFLGRFAGFFFSFFLGLEAIVTMALVALWNCPRCHYTLMPWRHSPFCSNCGITVSRVKRTETSYSLNLVQTSHTDHQYFNFTQKRSWVDAFFVTNLIIGVMNINLGSWLPAWLPFTLGVLAYVPFFWLCRCSKCHAHRLVYSDSHYPHPGRRKPMPRFCHQCGFQFIN